MGADIRLAAERRRIQRRAAGTQQPWPVEVYRFALFRIASVLRRSAFRRMKPSASFWS